MGSANNQETSKKNLKSHMSHVIGNSLLRFFTENIYNLVFEA